MGFGQKCSDLYKDRSPYEACLLSQNRYHLFLDENQHECLKLIHHGSNLKTNKSVWCHLVPLYFLYFEIIYLWTCLFWWYSTEMWYILQEIHVSWLAVIFISVNKYLHFSGFLIPQTCNLIDWLIVA